MTFSRGATLTTATTLGHSDRSDLGPTAGNGFYKRWPDDLALLHALGIDDVRLTIDWARLQPKPDEFDGDWSERFDNMLAAADAIDMRVWATLHDGACPRWIANEGGMGNVETVTRWWPRWVERVADRFGDRVHGWIPFAGLDPKLAGQPWADTWSILEGGEPPVVASLSVDNLGLINSLLDAVDLIGVALAPDIEPTHEPSGGELDRLGENIAGALHQAAELAAETPLVVSQFSPHNDDPDVAAQFVEQFVAATDAAIADGVDIGVAFIDPAIAGPDSPIGLLDKDRATQPAGDAYLSIAAADD